MSRHLQHRRVIAITPRLKGLAGFWSLAKVGCRGVVSAEVDVWGNDPGEGFAWPDGLTSNSGVLAVLDQVQAVSDLV